MPVKLRVKLDLRPLGRFKTHLRQGLAGGPGPIDDMYKQWAARYLAFAQRRYDRYSRGGGDWKPLDPKTIARRRFGNRGTGSGQTIGGARRKTLRSLRQARSESNATRGVRRLKRIAEAAASVAILKDTGTLRTALVQGSPGNLIQRIPGGIRVGIGGGKHPAGKMTIGRLAAIHDKGAGHVPQRRIIVPPDARTFAAMKSDVRRAVAKLGRASK